MAEFSTWGPNVIVTLEGEAPKERTTITLGRELHSQSVEAHLLLAILRKLESLADEDEHG